MKAYTFSSIIFMLACLSSVHLLSLEKSNSARRCKRGQNTPVTIAPTPTPAAYGVGNVRFVRVLSAQGPDSWLQISQLVVRNGQGVNVALKKPTSASSIWPGTSPATAVDGYEGTRAHPHQFHANGPNNQWWMVDLQKVETISQIRYYNRGDCCQKRILGARVQLLNESKEVLKEYTINHDGPETIIHTVGATPIYRTTAPTPVATGVNNVRFVRVLSAQGPDSWLQISQLVVRNGQGVNVALKKPTSASSIWPGTSPATAVDGYEGARAHPHEFHANGPNNQWWMVDLMTAQNVVQIRYYNRTDCCKHRIIGARVQLLNENKQVIKEYTINHDGPETIIHTL
jgi:hypothetical protein